MAKSTAKKELDRVEAAAFEVGRWRLELGDARRDLLVAMRDARKAGASLAAIGKAAGISRQRVKQLVD